MFLYSICSFLFSTEQCLLFFVFNVQHIYIYGNEPLLDLYSCLTRSLYCLDSYQRRSIQGTQGILRRKIKEL